jgi:cation/acetate symporter
VVALLCAILISFVYVAGQMRGVGIVFARFLGTTIDQGVAIGAAIVFLYAVLGGMKGITQVQVAQYVVLIAAYLVPAIFVSMLLTGSPIPPIGFGSRLTPEGAAFLGAEPGRHLLEVLDGLSTDLGFRPYTAGWRPRLDVVAITAALMIGTAGLPHIIIRFFTVPKIRDARSSAGWALVFIAVLYLAAPAVAAFARAGSIATLHGKPAAEAPAWFGAWQRTGLAAFEDKDGDGRMSISADAARNEVAIDPDILVLANPEIARLPAWVVALVAAGALGAALSTAAGLLLVIAAAISHDLVKSVLVRGLPDRMELWAARIAALAAAVLAARFGLEPSGRVAEVVAIAFGLAASSFFPVIVAGIFWKRATKEGAIAAMLAGVLFTGGYVAFFKHLRPDLDVPAHWWLGISPQGIGAVGALVAVAVLVAVSLATQAPPQRVQDLVASLRYPREAERPAAAASARRTFR